MSGVEWSLERLSGGLHDDIQQKLARGRSGVGHGTLMGDVSENVWLEMLQTYLPERYRAERATVIDSFDQASDQLDVVIFDRQYSPFILNAHGLRVIPAESVYAVFEAKQVLSAEKIDAAAKKVASARWLHRTSLPVPHVGGMADPKKPPYIIGGLLTFESAWTPALGDPLRRALAGVDPGGELDLGCVATHGHFSRDSGGGYTLSPEGKPATAFLFELIAPLQDSATVPMLDMRAYARWLTD
jgi:hypothetical protein